MKSRFANLTCSLSTIDIPTKYYYYYCYNYYYYYLSLGFVYSMRSLLFDGLYRVYITEQTKSEKGFEISAPYTPLADRSETSLWCSPLLDKRTLLCLINMILSLSICWVQCNSNIHFVSWCSCSFGLEVGLHLPHVSMFSLPLENLYNTH